MTKKTIIFNSRVKRKLLIRQYYKFSKTVNTRVKDGYETIVIRGGYAHNEFK